MTNPAVHTTTTKENKKKNYLVSGRENIQGLKILSSVENVAKQEIQPYIVSTLATVTYEQWKENFKSKGYGKKKNKKKIKSKQKKKQKTPKEFVFIGQTCQVQSINH